MKRAVVAVMTAATLAGCGGKREPVSAATASSVANDWRRVATMSDRDRLRTWRTVWLDSLGRARASGAAREIDAQGALFNPDFGLRDPMPPAGDYRCRVFKLGAKVTGGRDYVAYPAYSCRVSGDGEVRQFEKTAGSQRPAGRIFPHRPSRAIFLGTLAIGDEARWLAYGRDSARDLAGIVDRVGDNRWRLVLPQPAFDSTLEIIELVPAR